MEQDYLVAQEEPDDQSKILTTRVSKAERKARNNQN